MNILNLIKPKSHMKYKDFEDFLKDKHMQDYHGTDDDSVDAFEHWLSNMEIAQIVLLADLYGIQKNMEGYREAHDNVLKVLAKK